MLPSVVLLIDQLAGGGAERQCFVLTRGLRNAGFPASVVSRLSGVGTREAYKEAGASVLGPAKRLCGSSAVGFLERQFEKVRFARQLRQVCDDLKPIVLHGFLPFGNCLAGVIGSIARVPIVVASHRYAGSANLNYDLWQAAEAVVCRLADGNVANSDDVAAHLRRRLRLPQRTIFTVPNGAEVIDAASCQRLRDEVRAELGLGPSDLAVVKVANLWRYKGFQDLIRALAVALTKDPRLRTFFVGADRGYQASLERLVRAHDLGNRVTFLGDRRDVCRLLPAFDIYVSASRGEGMSNAIMEAMQHGLPVIASRVGGTAELLDDGRAGLLFEKGDTRALAEYLLVLAADERRRKELGEAAERRIKEHFSDRRMVAGTLEVYSMLARRKNLQREAEAFQAAAGLLGEPARGGRVSEAEA